ncbi:MAG: Fe-S cluster assembly protein SufD [Planctomycetota bacterium]
MAEKQSTRPEEVERFLKAHAAEAERFGADAATGLGAVRREALSRFAEIGLPTRKDEDWRSTDLGPILRTSFRAPPATGTGSDSVRDLVDRSALEESCRLTFRNGRLDPTLSSLDPLPEGVEVGTLEDRVAALTPGPRESEGSLALLNTAFFEQGVEITIRAGVEVARPIELLFVADSPSDPMMIHPRLRICLERGARACLLEQFVCTGGSANLFNNVVLDVEIAEGAALEHTKLVDESPSTCHLATNNVRVDRDGHYGSQVIELGGGLVRNELTVVLAAKGANCELDGLYSLSGKTHVDNHSRVDHAASNTTSRELYKGILDGQSRGVFFGRIIVQQDSQKIDAQQTNNNLLLSGEARADSTPQLEIYADDVRCRHGSTVGRLDEKALFYLRSRGISEVAARDLLIYAFANEIVDRIRIPALRERLAERLIRKGQP